MFYPCYLSNVFDKHLHLKNYENESMSGNKPKVNMNALRHKVLHYLSVKTTKKIFLVYISFMDICRILNFCIDETITRKYLQL